MIERRSWTYKKERIRTKLTLSTNGKNTQVLTEENENKRNKYVGKKLRQNNARDYEPENSKMKEKKVKWK